MKAGFAVAGFAGGVSARVLQLEMQEKGEFELSQEV